MHILNKNSITTKVNFIFLVFGFLLLLSFLIPAYFVGRDILEEKATSELESISVQKQLTLRGWLTNTEAFIYGIAKSHSLQKNLGVFYDTPVDSAQRQQASSDLGKELSGWISTENGFATISLVDQESGIVIASTEAKEIGRNDIHKPYFYYGKAGLFVQNPYISEISSEPFIRIALPVSTSDGQAKAVFAVRIRLNKIIEIVYRGEKNTSMYFYLVNREKQVVVPPRYLPNAVILKDTIQDPTVDKCFGGDSGAFKILNSQNKQVVATHTEFPEMELCLIVEKDIKDAYADIHKFSGNVVLSAMILSVFGLFVAFILSRYITKPVYQLVHQVELFGKGQLSLGSEPHSDDEIGMISRTFHQMAISLSQSIEEIKRSAQENLRLYQRANEHAIQLEAEKALLSKLLNTSSNLIVILDSQGRVIQPNKTVEVMTGYAYSDIVGKVYSELSEAPNGVLGPVNPMDRLLKGEFPNYIEQDFTNSQGEKKRITWSSDALFNSSGQVEYVICVGTDITEIKKIQEQLRESERNFQIALAAAPISVYTTDQDYRITFIHTPYPGFNPNNLLGKKVDSFLSAEAAETIFAIQKAVFETGHAQMGLISVNFSGEPTYYSYYIKPILNDSGSVMGLACAGYDITEQKKIEQALVEIKNNLEKIVVERTRELQRSYKMLQTTLDALPEVAGLYDRKGILLFGNKSLSELLHTPLDQLVGTNIFSYLPAKVAAIRKAKAEQAFVTGHTVRFIDERNGRYYDSVFHPVIGEDSQDPMLAFLAIDVTDWKRAQDAIAAGRERLKELARKVVVAQEEERQRISRELHDEAGQALTALSITLSFFHRDLPDNHTEEKKRIGDAVSLVTTTLDRIRSLAQDLRPQLLDTMGINQALEGFCQEFSRRTRINIQYQGMDIPHMQDITSITFYRILQEALTNAAKHSHTKKISVAMSLEQDIVTLMIQDYGVGFARHLNDQTEAGSGGPGIGLASMKERIEMIGGKLEITSTLGKGTVIVAMASIDGDPIERRSTHDQSRSRG